MKQRTGPIMRIAAPLRTLTQRFAFLTLLVAAAAIMLVGKTDPTTFERARMAVTDFVAPMLDAASRPIATTGSAIEEGRRLMAVHEENQRLREENVRLLQWRVAADRLQSENARLRELLAFHPKDAERYVTARVIGDRGGAFMRSILVNEGSAEGVRKGQAALVGEGLLGRVASVGERSARVLLITDLNSRIPVLVAETRARAVLAGDNSDTPRLEFVSSNAGFEVGQRIVTSGHGGAFPPGIPVGVVSSVGEGGVRVQPYASADRLEYVRLVEYGLSGVLTDRPEATATAAR